ncbi:MAG: SpoIIE family protein phosphatase [Comamonas sp.]|jgi:sigma-B regulation protein RsbU (phosphoserine phosphatase)|nr:SpoIIE family protein phosphatase [Comamonas sp.]
MLLRTRITLMAAVGLLLTALGLGGAGLLREQLLLQRLAATTQAAQTALWAEALAAEDQTLDQYADRLVLAPHFLQAVRRADPAAIAQAMAQAGLKPGPGQPLDLAAVLSLGRSPVIQGQVPQRVLLDADSLERAVAGDVMDGLRVLGADQVLVISTRRLPDQSEPAVLALARDAHHALQHMARRTASVVTLLDLRGNLLATTDAELWRVAARHVMQRAAQHGELELGGKTYALSSMPVNDLAGHAAGTLITLADHTQDAAASRFLGRLALGAIAALLLAVLLGLNFYLRRSLRPLEHSIDALQALAQGDASVRLPYVGNDEIGRIARAVAAFRRNAQELAAARALRERVRRRQERLLRTKLQSLAEATHQPLALQAGDRDEGGDEEQLRQLAGVMNELSGRLIDQHQRLTGMVQELREALVTKNRLAGLEQELQIAAQVQLSILPRQQPQDARVQLHCHITPAREVGGDFYDYFFIDDAHLGFVIADVSGKGVPAALFMTITRTLLKATAQFIAEPTKCLGQLNDLLAAENEQMMFVTLFYGVLNLESGQLRYVNAGHNPPYLLRADGGVALLPRTGGMAVAVSEGFPYRAGSAELGVGDQLFLYTDGVTEAFDPDGQEYGEPRLEQVLHTLMAGPEHAPIQVAAGVLADVHAFERGAPQADDITCVALRYMGS